MYTAFLAPFTLFSAKVLNLRLDTLVKVVSLHEKNAEQHNRKIIENISAMLVVVLTSSVNTGPSKTPKINIFLLNTNYDITSAPICQ